MEIIQDERTYEGLPAVPAMVMALMEDSGIRKMIDDSCRAVDKGCYDLSPGMAVKAMVGAMVERGKRPLYRVEDYYSTAPVDLMFGKDVSNKSLCDTTLANRLDVLFRLDTRSVQLAAYRLLQEKYGFAADCLFMDASNYTMFGLMYVCRQMDFDLALTARGEIPKISPMPAYGGNAKDGHNDRLQVDISHIVDQNGIPIVTHSYSGNTSDIRMNEDMLDYISRQMDLRRCVLMGDCKLCVMDMLKHLLSSDVKFVTKVPASFDGKVREDVIRSILGGTMDCSISRPGRLHYETSHDIDGHRVRLIAYLLPKSRRDSEDYIRGACLRRFQKRLRSLSRRTFFCEADAMDAFRDLMGSAEVDCFKADAEVYRDEATMRRKGDGKMYRLRISDAKVDDGRLESAVIAHAAQVLITNLPFSDEHSEDPRAKASADDVIDLYLEQFKAEAGFKMMKSGMEIGKVYIHTPSRITAVAFVVALATMLCSVANMVLKDRKPKGERRQTVKTLADIHMNTLVWYNREKDRMTITGKPGDTKLIFGYLDRLGIDPKYMLTYRCLHAQLPATAMDKIRIQESFWNLRGMLCFCPPLCLPQEGQTFLSL